MSTTVQGVDARGYLAGWLQAVTGMMVSDINAIPEEKWTETFGGCTRPANAMLADTITNMLWTISTMKGEETDVYNSMSALAVELSTKEAGIAALTETSAALGAAIVEASDETLNSMATAPWGAQVPVFILATVAVNHIWYHDGQLNYIQCHLGDEKVHWMV